MTRKKIIATIAKNKEKIAQLEADNLFLLRESYMLNDDVTQYIEEERDVVISKRPKIVEKQLLGFVTWEEDFIDEDTNEVVTIRRHKLVKRNGEWVV